MKIYIYGVDWYGGFERGVQKALTKKGINVRFLCNSSLWKKNRYFLPKLFKKRFPINTDKAHDNYLADLKKDINDYAPDYILIFGGYRIREEYLKELIYKYRYKVLCWLVDDPFRNETVVKNLQHYHHIFIYDNQLIKEVRDMNQNVTYVPNCTDFELYSKNYKYNLKLGDFSFIGNAIGDAGKIRSHFVSSLTDKNIIIYGDSRWKDYFTTYPALKSRCIFKTLNSQQCSYIYQNTPVNIDINHPQNICSVTQRTFDIPASGGFALTQYNESLEELFESDQLITYSTKEELHDKAIFYLNKPELRKKVIDRCKEHVFNFHTFDNRITQIIPIIEQIKI